jgi:hypothetical protein
MPHLPSTKENPNRFIKSSQDKSIHRHSKKEVLKAKKKYGKELGILNKEIAKL